MVPAVVVSADERVTVEVLSSVVYDVRSWSDVERGPGLVGALESRVSDEVKLENSVVMDHRDDTDDCKALDVTDWLRADDSLARDDASEDQVTPDDVDQDVAEDVAEV